jgi:hypothetical protein
MQPCPGYSGAVRCERRREHARERRAYVVIRRLVAPCRDLVRQLRCSDRAVEQVVSDPAVVQPVELPASLDLAAVT